MNRQLILTLLGTLFSLGAFGCTTMDDITHEKPYAQLVGQRLFLKEEQGLWGTSNFWSKPVAPYYLVRAGTAGKLILVKTLAAGTPVQMVRAVRLNYFIGRPYTKGYEVYLRVPIDEQAQVVANLHLSREGVGQWLSTTRPTSTTSTGKEPAQSALRDCPNVPVPYSE
ncbi:MAG TPA: hypothetical protein VF669_21580 [Tepidisphaeraceae bacterium]|jgi:hypothetical protein